MITEYSLEIHQIDAHLMNQRHFIGIAAQSFKLNFVEFSTRSISLNIEWINGLNVRQ